MFELTTHRQTTMTDLYRHRTLSTVVASRWLQQQRRHHE